MATKPSPKDLIASWRNGADGFLKFLDDVQPRIPSEKGGFQPYTIPNDLVRDEIRRALDTRYSTLVFCWPRRHGKTVMTALIIVWRFLTRRTQTIAIVSNSEKQSVDTAFKLVRTILEQTPYTSALIKSEAIKIGADAIHYEAVNNVIQAFPASQAALYGKKLSIAQVSELHAARSDALYQVLASSTIDTEDGLVLVDSTVGARSSPLFALYNLAQAGTDDTLCFSHIEYRDLADAIARGPSWISPAKLKSRAAQMLPIEFAQQHLNQWTAANNSLFPAEVIERCRDRYPLDPKAIADGAAFVVGAGLDRAYGFSLHGDSTVTTAVLKTIQGEDEHYFVLASDDIKFSSAAGIKKALTRYYKDFGMSRAAIETYNAQDIGAWAGEQKFQHELVVATAERQSGAFTALFNAANEGRLHIHPALEKLFQEMETFEYRLEGTGTSKGSIAKFEAAKGCHDDHIYSLAWAVYALRDLELNPYELNGIHCFAAGPSVNLCIMNGGNLVPPCSDTCRSFAEASSIYQKYLSRSAVSPMSLEDFVSVKARNVGSHTLPR